MNGCLLSQGLAPMVIRARTEYAGVLSLASMRKGVQADQAKALRAKRFPFGLEAWPRRHPQRVRSGARPKDTCIVRLAVVNVRGYVDESETLSAELLPFTLEARPRVDP
jgi:hypothetical protein